MLCVIHVRLNKVDNACDGRRFRVIASYLSKVAISVDCSTCFWRLSWRWPRLSFAEIFGVRNRESRGYRVPLFADHMFSRFSRTPTCDRQTDRRRRHNTALAWRHAVKIKNNIVSLVFYFSWKTEYMIASYSKNTVMECVLILCIFKDSASNTVMLIYC